MFVQILVEADENSLYLRSKHTNTVSLSSWVTWIASTCLLPVGGKGTTVTILFSNIPDNVLLTTYSYFWFVWYKMSSWILPLHYCSSYLIIEPCSLVNLLFISLFHLLLLEKCLFLLRGFFVLFTEGAIAQYFRFQSVRVNRKSSHHMLQEDAVFHMIPMTDPQRCKATLCPVEANVNR